MVTIMVSWGILIKNMFGNTIEIITLADSLNIKLQNIFYFEMSGVFKSP